MGADVSKDSEQVRGSGVEGVDFPSLERARRIAFDELQLSCGLQQYRSAYREWIGEVKILDARRAWLEQEVASCLERVNTLLLGLLASPSFDPGEALSELSCLRNAILPPRVGLVDTRIADESSLLSSLISVVPGTLVRDLLSRQPNHLLEQVDRLKVQSISQSGAEKLLSLIGPTLPGEKWWHCKTFCDDSSFRAVRWQRAGETKGFVLWDGSKDSSSQLMLGLWVAPEFRRQGVARGLFFRAIREAHSLGKEFVLACVPERRVGMCGFARDVGMEIQETESVRTPHGVEAMISFISRPSTLLGRSVPANEVQSFMTALGGYANAFSLARIRRDCFRLLALNEAVRIATQRYGRALHHASQIGASAREIKEQVVRASDRFRQELNKIRSSGDELVTPLASHVQGSKGLASPQKSEKAVSRLLEAETPAFFRRALSWLGPVPWVDRSLARSAPPCVSTRPYRATDSARLTRITLTGSEEEYRVLEGGFAEVLHCEDARVVVADIGRVPWGFALTQKRGKQVEILRLVVDVEKRSQGLGGKLLDRVIYDAWRAGGSSVEVSVPLIDLHVLGFLSRRGFTASPGITLSRDGHEMVRMGFGIFEGSFP